MKIDRENRTLLEAMDAAAHSLIRAIDPDPDVEVSDGEKFNLPTLPEKMKMFATLIDYVKWRENPSGTSSASGDPPKSKFQLLKGEFNNGRGNKAKGRAGRGDSASGPAPTPTDDDDD